MKRGECSHSGPLNCVYIHQGPSRAGHIRSAVECSCCCCISLVEDQPSVASENNQERSVFVVVSLETSLVLHFHNVCKSTDDFCLSGSLCVTKVHMVAEE